MVCECSWAPGPSRSLPLQARVSEHCDAGDPLSMACSEDSGCINYLTQVECLESECRCHKACQNQRCALLRGGRIIAHCPRRFNRKQYAPIEIVQTEKKGYGVRLMAAVPKSVAHHHTRSLPTDGALTATPSSTSTSARSSARRRSRSACATTPTRACGTFTSCSSSAKRSGTCAHACQLPVELRTRPQFIDATKKGGLGRFLNHSCNPNCYIAKWVVGRQLRMGIFTKRKVNKGEELTFNYNVDRYGRVLSASPIGCLR